LSWTSVEVRPYKKGCGFSLVHKEIFFYFFFFANQLFLELVAKLGALLLLVFDIGLLELKVAHDEAIFSCLLLELVDRSFKQRHVEQTVVWVLRDLVGRPRDNVLRQACRKKYKLFIFSSYALIFEVAIVVPVS